ncbi:MAG: hypothetical protein Q9170_000428 [Blastenia crenularia]
MPTNIEEAVASHTTCSASTVTQLKLSLFPKNPIQSEISNVPNVCPPKSRPAQPSRSGRRQPRKQPDVTVCESRKDIPTSTSRSGPEKLATAVVNIVLKALTEAVKSHTPAEDSSVRIRSIHAITAKSTICSPRAWHHAQAPLQPLCANNVVPEKGLAKESPQSGQSDGTKAGCGFYAQAECARLALSALATYRTHGHLGNKSPDLQLENAMSTCVSKLLAMELVEPAQRQLRELKKALLIAVGEGKVDNLLHERVCSKERMTDLLILPSNIVKGPLLAMAVTFQLQVLRLIAIKRDTTHFQATIEHLQSTNSYSPITLIQAQIDPSNLTTRSKVASQLEALSRLLLSMCPSTLTDKRPNSNSLSSMGPLIAFRFQLLALELRPLWWECVDHKVDIGKDLLEPFSRYLRTFRQRCTNGLKGGYSQAVHFLAIVKSTPQDCNQSPSTSTVYNGVWRSIYAELIEISRKCSFQGEAQCWLGKYINLSTEDGDSPCQRCIMVCQRTVLCAQILVHHSRQSEVVNALQDTEQHLVGDLQGGSKELDELLLVVTRIRKAAASFINKSRMPLGDHEIRPSPELIRQCYRICSTCVAFLKRYVGSKPSSNADHLSSLRYKQRLEQALPTRQVFADSVISVAKLTKGDDAEEWIRTDAGLQACLSLACPIEDDHQVASGEDKDANIASSIPVLVSNAYWLRYLHMKQSNDTAKEALKALKASIGAVEQQTLASKRAAQLHVRLEQYGNVLEAAREYSKATEMYMKAIRTHRELGFFHEAATAAATQPISVLFVQNPGIACLGRVLGAYLRVASKIQAADAPNHLFWDDSQLEPPERGVVLEYQLFSLISQLRADKVEPQMNTSIPSLATELLDIYIGQVFPVRRLRVIDSLVWLQATRPVVLAPNLVEQLKASEMDTTAHKLNGSDSGLQSLLPHLKASRDAALVIQEDCHLQKQEKSELAITCWHHLVEQSHDLEALQTKVGDVPTWLLHLEILAQYLDAYGLNLQRRSLLDLISTIRARFFPTQHLELLLSLTRSGLHHLRLGYPGHGGLAFHKAMRFIRLTELRNGVIISFYVAYAEYFLQSGNISKCEENLAIAREKFEGASKEKDHTHAIHDQVESARLMAEVASLYSDLAARRGQLSDALNAARKSLRLAYRAWTNTEKRQRRTKREDDNTAELVDPMSKVAISDNGSAEQARTRHGRGSMYWRLTPQLHKAYMQVACLYAKEGMFNEARYYFERSQKLAENASSPGLSGRSLSHLADLLTRSEDYVGASEFFGITSGQLDLVEEDQYSIELQVNLAKHHLAKGQIPVAGEKCSVAESILWRLVGDGSAECGTHEQPDVAALQEQVSRINIGKRTSRPDLKKRIPIKDSSNQDKAVVQVAKAGEASASSTQASLPALCRSQYDILMQRLQLAVRENKLERASEVLLEAAKYSLTPQDMVLHAISSAEICVGRGLDAVKSDPVYCVLPESTISIPSALVEEPLEPVDPPSTAPTKAGRKPIDRGPVVHGNKKARNLPKAGDRGIDIRQAQISVSKVYQLAISVSPMATLRHLSRIMAEVLLSLSALNVPSAEGVLNPNLPRSVSVTRERLTCRVDKDLSKEDDLPSWPCGNTQETKSLQLSDQSLDFTSFQKQYLDIIPRTWQVLSVSLNRSRREVLVCRIRPAQSPFALSLPLDRHSSRDPHEENFGYFQAKTELQEIIALADHSTHSTQDLSGKGARAAWWEGRATLDARLKDLLTNMETMWFGGFQGVFSQHLPDHDLLSRFQESLNVVLSNHLPSRRGLGKRQKSQQRIQIDPRVIELFVALGDPALFSDMEEPLMDLLYFVIDILQFHGERNAYDEIDFDTMTIEIFDALRQYHEAAKRTVEQSAVEHTILILDKELHCFPWESLPSLDGQAVTRLPSLSCLRDRILQQQEKGGADGASGGAPRFCVDRRRGAYVLNPAGDLQATEAKFAQPLNDLCEWEGLTASTPDENRFKGYLKDKDVFLYFGHGSGSQYIRSRTIQKLDRCAVALLMGCSSGKLTEAGEFEAYGTPMSYMQAGCPAMVATLWDVTDKDIDRFSETMLQKWGLFASHPPPNNSPVKKSIRTKGKSKVQQSPRPSKEDLSLDQAVAHGRRSCIFRYLNGAAPVVYGIPMFLS